MVVFGQGGCSPSICLYLGSCGVIPAKVFDFGQSGCNGVKFFFRVEVVVFGLSGCIWARVVVIGKVVVFGQSGCVFAKVLVFGQKGL